MISENENRTTEIRKQEADLKSIALQRQMELAEEKLVARPKDINSKNVLIQEANSGFAQESLQSKMLSIARSVALKSQQALLDPELKILLACQAFRLNVKYKGESNDKDIYNGLYQALKSYQGSSYNVFRGHNDAVRSVHFLPGEYSFISSGDDGRILKWDGTDPSAGYSVISERKNPVESIKITDDGKWLVCVEDKNGVLIFDFAGTGQAPKIIKDTDKDINVLALAPDSKTFYSAGSGNVIKYWDLPGGRSRHFAETQAHINSLALSPDGILLAGGTGDGKIIVWVTKGETVSSIIFNDSATSIQRVCFSPDYKFIAAGKNSGEILIFKVGNFEFFKTLQGHTAKITNTDFSPDGKTLASTSSDGKVLIWNTEDFTRPPIILDDHTGPVFTISFSSDGKYIVSGSAQEDRLLIRPVNSDLLEEQASSLVGRDLTREEWKTYIGPDIQYEKMRKKE